MSDSDSQSNPSAIAKFPNEILLLIFNHLNFADFKNASEVCSRWNQVISSMDQFIEKADVKLNFDSKDLITRQYKRLSITVGNKNDPFRDFEQLLGGGRGGDVASNYFENISLCSENLQSLQIEDCSVFKLIGHDSLCEPVHLPNLSSLKVNKCSWILKYLKIAELNDLSIDSTCLEMFLEFQGPRRKPREVRMKDAYVVEFLNKLERIDTLTLKGVNFATITKLEPKFRWRHLIIEPTMRLPIEPGNVARISMESWQNLFKAASDLLVAITCSGSHRFNYVELCKLIKSNETPRPKKVIRKDNTRWSILVKGV